MSSLHILEEISIEFLETYEKSIDSEQKSAE